MSDDPYAAATVRQLADWLQGDPPNIGGVVGAGARRLLALDAQLRAVVALADQYRANCAPDSVQAQVAELFRSAAGVGVSEQPDEPKCICDGGAYFTAEQNRQRLPFIVRAGCPIHVHLPAEVGVSPTPTNEETDECRFCKGVGRVPKPCALCRGTGWVTTSTYERQTPTIASASSMQSRCPNGCASAYTTTNAVVPPVRGSDPTSHAKTKGQPDEDA